MTEQELNLSGNWLSRYEYTHGSSQHHVVLKQNNDYIVIESSSDPNGSKLSLDLKRDGNILTGSWREGTSPGGPYKGKEFYGVVQLILDNEGERMTGKWAGFNSDKTKINTGDWTLERE